MSTKVAALFAMLITIGLLTSCTTIKKKRKTGTNDLRMQISMLRLEIEELQEQVGLFQSTPRQCQCVGD